MSTHQPDQPPKNYDPSNGHDDNPYYVHGDGTKKYKAKGYNQDDINYGQARINYELVEANKKLIAALELLVNGLPGVDPKVKTLIEEAKKTNEGVAGIKPPGCEPLE